MVGGRKQPRQDRSPDFDLSFVKSLQCPDSLSEGPAFTKYILNHQEITTVPCHSMSNPTFNVILLWLIYELQFNVIFLPLNGVNND